jgi:hypothetical protein
VCMCLLATWMQMVVVSCALSRAGVRDMRLQYYCMHTGCKLLVRVSTAVEVAACTHCHALLLAQDCCIVCFAGLSQL